MGYGDRFLVGWAAVTVNGPPTGKLNVKLFEMLNFERIDTTYSTVNLSSTTFLIILVISVLLIFMPGGPIAPVAPVRPSGPGKPGPPILKNSILSHNLHQCESSFYGQ